MDLVCALYLLSQLPAIVVTAVKEQVRKKLLAKMDRLDEHAPLSMLAWSLWQLLKPAVRMLCVRVAVSCVYACFWAEVSGGIWPSQAPFSR